MSAMVSDTPTPPDMRTSSGLGLTLADNYERTGTHTHFLPDIEATVKLEPAASADGEVEVETATNSESYTNHVHLQPQIKSERPLEIIDTQHAHGSLGALSSSSSPSETVVGDEAAEAALASIKAGTVDGPSNCDDSPKIRLTPTIKLMATPNSLDPKRKFPCPYENCAKSYGKSSHLRSHLTWHTGIKPFVCQEPNCGKGFTRSDELNRHVRTHTGEKPYECIQCTKKFSRSDHLTKHLATHAKQMQNTLTPSKRMSGARNHQNQNHHIHSGQQQQSQSQQEHGTVPSSIPAPIRNFTEKDGVDDDEPDTKKVFMEMQSPPDNMRFSDGLHFMAALAEATAYVKQGLSNETENLTEPAKFAHMPIKIKLERPEPSGEYHVVPPSTETSTATPTPAPICSTGAAPQESTIAMPLPKHNVPKEVIMPISTMTWPTAPAIKTEPMPQLEHITNETIYDDPCERPFECSQCPKRFKRQDDLNRHVRTHTGEKPFVCVECDRRFMRSDHLKKHLQTHIRLR